MSLSVYDFLAWRPADLERAAHWFVENSRLLDRVARTVRDGAERGTEAQQGAFIDAVRHEADTTARRIDGLADTMLEAGTELRNTGAHLATLVGQLRALVAAAEGAGFVVEENADVVDGRATFDTAEERYAREEEARIRESEIWDKLAEIRQADDVANYRLHGVVSRDVRDRTPEGNGDLSTTIPAAAGGTMNEAISTKYEAMMESGRRALSGPWWNTARGFGVVGNLLGFIGGVANAPDDEPLHETLLAEGAGVLGGIVGAKVLAVVGARGGPVTALTAHFAGGVGGAALASSEVREAFDRAH